MLDSPIHVKLLSTDVDDPSCSTFTWQTIKELNCYIGKRKQILVVKTRLETITSLIVGIATIYWSCRHEIIMCRWMAGQFSFGEIEVCNMHVHILFCQKRIALLFPNPTSASLAIPHVRVVMVVLRTMPFYTTWFAPNFGYARGIK